jgi:tetratricopeptide (TPR) repeat protein
MFLLISPGIPVFSQVFPETNKDPEKTAQERTIKENEQLGIQYFRNRDYEKSLQIFEGLYELKPSHLNYTYYLNSLLGLENYDDAEKLIKKHTRKKRNVRYAVDLGFVMMEGGKADKADKLLQGLIDDMQPKRNDVIVLANAFNSRRFYDYAVKTYLKGRELLSETYAFHEELARLYQITGDYDSMIMEYLSLIEYEPGMISVVQSRLQNILSRDTDGGISEKIYESLLIRSQDNPDNIYITEMLLWHSIQEKNFRFAMIQAISLDKRLGEDGNRVFSLAAIALSNKDYKVATEGFEYLILKGNNHPYYVPSKTGFLRARFLEMTSNPAYDPTEIQELEIEYEIIIEELGIIPESIQMRRDRARLLAFFLDRMDESISALNTAINLPGARPEDVAGCKIDLADIYLFVGEVWEATLLYSQVEKAFKNDPIGQEAKFKNAKLSFYIGEFGWAKAQLDVLKAATTKFIANDAMELSLLISDNLDADSSNTGLKYYATAELLTFQNKDSLAITYLDSIFMVGMGHPLNDEVLYTKAKIYIKQKDFVTADSLLQKIVQMYPMDILADNALLMRGELQEKAFNNTEKAMELYQQLLVEYPGSLQTTEARRRFRMLRGDNPDS